MQLKGKMKLQRQLFASCLLLVSFSPHSSGNQNSFLNACPQVKTNSEDHKNVRSECAEFALELIDYLSIITDIFKLKNRNLVIIIADDTKGATSLARFLTHDKKVLPQKEYEDFNDSEKPLYDFILENFQAYENLNTSTVFFPYPTNTNNKKFANEIASEVVRSAKNAKIILTLPSLSFDTENFVRKRELRVQRLFEVAAKIIRNVKKFENSTLLVVTNDILKGNSLLYKNDLNTDQEKEHDYRELIGRYAEKLDSSNNGKLLAKYMIRGKEKIIFSGEFTRSGYKKVITHLNTNVIYTTANVLDFENKFHLFLDCLFSLADSMLTLNINSLKSNISFHFSSEETLSGMSTLSSVITFPEKLDATYKSLSSFLNCMLKNDLNLFNSCFNNLNKSLQPLGILHIDNVISTSYKYLPILCLVNMFSYVTTPKSEYINQPEKWTLVLKKYTEGNLKTKRDWYSKLKTTYDTVDFWSEKETSDAFLNLLEDLIINEDKHSNTAIMKNAYYTVKRNTMKMQANFSCVRLTDGIKMQVTGKLLRLSQILNKTHGTENYKILELFALEKIIIDRDLIAVGQELQVFIFSPIWEIVSVRNIILDGASRNLTINDHLDSKAKNGNQLLNRNGAHGQAGLPGGPAGTFYGIGETIINGETLKISVNGGNGSNGQDGGNAADREDGETPSESYINSMLNKHGCYWVRFYSLNYKVEASNKERTYVPLIGNPPYPKYQSECYIYGLKGIPGGNGGNGGIKGKGSMAGDYKLFLLNDSPKIPVVLLALNGTDGRHGVGGKKGKGGFTRKVTMRNFDYFNYGIVETTTISRVFDGNNGNDNTSTVGSKVAKEMIVLQSFAHTTNLYKQYILSHIISHNESKYIDLYKQVINNKNIHKTYDILAFVNELTDLEEHYYRMENKLDALFFYESWRERLIDYSTHRKDNEKTDQYNMILRNLDNMVSKKIKRLIKNSNNYLIFMHAEYLAECQEEIKNLRNAKTIVKIKNINSNYTEEFDEKIEEAQRIIQEDIQKEIDKNNFELNGETEMLLRQIVSLTEKERKRSDELAKKFVSVEKKLAVKTFNDIFEFINTGLAFINPSLATIGTKISAAGSIVQNFIDESPDRNVIGVVIPKTIDKSREYFETLVEAKKEVQKLTVETSLEMINKKKEELKKKGKDIKPFESVEASVEELRNLTAFNKLPENDIVKVLDDKLNKEKIILQQISANKKNIYKKAIETIKQLKTLSQIKQMVGDLSTKFTKLNGKTDLDGVIREIHKAFQSTLELRNFKEEVYMKMLPLIERIREKADITGEVSSSSIVYLDLKKFEMKKFFEEVLSRLENFIAKFKVEAFFEKTIKNTNAVVNMILSTYARIEDYVETKKQVNYERNLSLVPFDITYVKDVKLSTALANMIQLSFANIVLDNYYKWMASFKQHIFPFAEDFFVAFQSPISKVDDLLTRAEEAGNELESYVIKLSKMKTELRECKKSVPAEFGYSLSPFHVWNNSMYSTDINNILAGEKVTFFANISEHWILNAVKFSNVWLRFISTNPNIKDEDIKRDLEGFSIKLLHNGDSYYRCDNRVFLIRSEAEEFENVYNVRRYKLVSKIEETEIYGGKGGRDCVLSPYATWTMQLVIRDKNKSFKILENYKSNVNVGLVGLGQYTVPNITVCKSNLTEYYENEVQLKDVIAKVVRHQKSNFTEER